MNPKQLTGEKSAEYVKDGMTVGLGTGSTAYWAIQALGARVKEGLSIKAIATSNESEQLAKELNIPIVSFTEVTHLDVTIDGADEVDKHFNLIKGGGGALLREKIVAFGTKHYITIVDESKCVETLGKFSLPVEVVQFGYEWTFNDLKSLGCTPVLRKKNDAVFITDNGNYIADCAFGTIKDPVQLNEYLNQIPGVVENGLFINRTNTLIVGHANGEVNVIKAGN